MIGSRTGFWFRAFGFGLLVSGFWFRAFGFGLSASGFGVWALASGFSSKPWLLGLWHF
jgi:hypothetical protein